MEGVDVNNVFYLDTKTYPEYPAPPFIPGTQAFGTDGSAWTYVTASVSLGNGSVCIVSEVPGSWSVALAGGATVATPPTGDILGVVAGSTGTLLVGAPSGTQTGSFFWMQRFGNCQALNCAASTTKDALLHSSATVAGQVTSTSGGSGTSYQLSGIVVSQATGSAAGPNTAILNWPTVGVTA
jgi:hypothetical protein